MRNTDTRPGMLLLHAREKRGGSQLPEDELRELAREHWPGRPDEWIEDVVAQAIEQRDRGQRRIDPATVPDLVHPSKRRRKAMPTKAKIEAAVRAELEADPDVDYGALNNRVQERLGTHVSQYQTSQLARYIRRELEDAEPSTNGAKPTPDTPSAAEAEPDASPATDAVEGEETGQEEAEGAANAPSRPIPVRESVKAEPALVASTSGSSSWSPPVRSDRVQVDVSDGRARLFVDVHDLDPATAYRISADVQRSLAGAVV